MNKLPLEKRTQIINLLVEGNSMRATSRIADVSINTVTKLLVEVGYACQMFHNETVVNLKSERVQADEIWSFCYAKQKNVPDGMHNAGDVWTWTAIDADSKLIISWLVGDRSFDSGLVFVHDLERRVKNRIQLTTDGLSVYKNAVNIAFGKTNIDFAQLHKHYGGTDSGSQNPTERKYSPAECTGVEVKTVSGCPDPAHISTSYVERQNLTMRMHMRRFTRLTNGLSKKIENHCYAIALHFVYYNWCKIHKTLRVTPAMEGGLTTELMEISDIVKLTEKYRQNSN